MRRIYSRVKTTTQKISIIRSSFLGFGFKSGTVSKENEIMASKIKP
jgi:hypothetical protein